MMCMGWGRGGRMPTTVLLRWWCAHDIKLHAGDGTKELWHRVIVTELR